MVPRHETHFEPFPARLRVTAVEAQAIFSCFFFLSRRRYKTFPGGGYTGENRRGTFAVVEDPGAGCHINSAKPLTHTPRARVVFNMKLAPEPLLGTAVRTHRPSWGEKRASQVLELSPLVSSPPSAPPC